MPSAPESSNETGKTISRRGALGLLFGGVAMAVVGCGPDTARPNASVSPSPDQPSPSETPSPSPSEILPELESQEEEAQKILDLPHTRFNHRDMIDRQLAVDMMFVRFVTDNKVGFSITDSRLGENSPAFLAALGEDNREATAHSILNQLVFAQATIFGQFEDPQDINNPNIDNNTAANMVSGLYYDHEGPRAQVIADRAMKSKRALSYTEKHWFGEDENDPDNKKGEEVLSSSEVLRTHDFGLGPIEYKVINYTDGSNRRYVIVTPYESTYIGPDPLGSYETKETTIVKWLIVHEGKGEESTEGNLQNFN